MVKLYIINYAYRNNNNDQNNTPPAAPDATAGNAQGQGENSDSE